MAILGLYDGHNSCAAVISEETGDIVAAVEEERFSRIKNHDSRRPGVPGPVRSIAYCVEQSAEPITHVALALAAPDDLVRLATNAFLDAVRDGESARLDSVALGGGDFFDLLQLPRFTQARRIAKCLATLRSTGVDAGYRARPGAAVVRHVPHHTAHAAGAFLRAPDDDALVVVLDGMGDGLSGLIARGRGHGMRPLDTIDAARSLGHLYSAFTVACGFEGLRHEGKVTALAASGKVNEAVYTRLADLFRYDPATGRWRGGLGTGLPLGPYPHRLMIEYHERVQKLVANIPVEDAAATVQQFTEDIICELIRYHLAVDQVGTVVVAGGLFANVSVNRRIADLAGVDRLFVHPAMSDAGLAVGAASHLFAELHGRRPPAMGDAFLGPGYSDREAADAFRSAGFSVRSDVDPEEHLAGALAAGHIVARFVGRGEYGPRALGNRSIFAPCDASVPPVLNRMLRRSELMPFAPMTLADEADDLYQGLRTVSWSAEYMTVAVACSRTMRERSPGAVHRDGTARPQIVRPAQSDLHSLLASYRSRTGSGTLINTSLNIHEEPMVLNPHDAVRSITTAGIEQVQVGGLICSRS
ncbi:carbamoyltransferase C-terminal domain-containing protein [Virgisporangium aurantiacum]|uniref:Carbamoyltransferase n=1 Tax=Virgisporangium aurantiacum TaxID=175570 RepID=A0A8J3Z6T2_9ACTN|nr:carbamoyltransferase C-terminal domain-containing protein [Virgisporangium aurantiacum]GIJ57442.1 carbamoyltransferase [Virgisporangium aurantiacum]